MANLQKRGWMENIVCVLCRVEEETVNYLFTQCVVSRFLIVMAVEGVWSRNLENDVRSEWD